MRPLTIQHVLLIAAFGIGATTTLPAQETDAVPPDTTDIERANPGPDPRFLTRVFPAAGLGAAGAFLGGLIALPMWSGHDGGALAVGLMAGGTLGSAFGAAAPKGRGLCTENQRFGRALAGAGMGLLTSISIMRGNEQRAAWLAVIPVGSVMLMWRC